ncbi:MAG: hypothetical protein RL199_1963, partial [Pseudomonadota bacterium]
MAAGPAVAEEACPADLPVVLAQQPARLASCRAEDRRSRVFAAQALAKIGRRAEAADRYRALAEEWPALAEVFALRAAEQSPEPSVPAPTGRRWLDSARTRLSVEASVGMDGPLLEAAAKAATDLGLDGAGLHLMLLRAAVRLRDEAAVLRELRVLRLRYAGGAEEREALAVCGDRLPVTSLEDDELARRWNGWTARAGAGEVAAECRPLATRRSRLAGAALLACGRALATVRSEAAAGLLERAAASKDVEADALLALARVRARGTDDGVVVRACARLAKVRRSASQKADCDYLAAFQTLQHGRRGEGRRRLEAVVHDHRRTPRASDAAWLLAFDDWTYDKAAAFERFDAMVRSTKDADDKA